MHAEAIGWLRKAVNTYPANFSYRRVLDVGSRNVNGSPRDYFFACDYVGIDIMPGKDVDIVTSVCDLALDAPIGFHTIVCMEMLEHDKDWRDSLQAMYELLEPQGLLIITAAGPNRPEHGTHEHTPADSPATLDYYRNIHQEDLAGFSLGRFSEYSIQYGREQQDIYFTGLKGE